MNAANSICKKIQTPVDSNEDLEHSLPRVGIVLHAADEKFSASQQKLEKASGALFRWLFRFVLPAFQ